MIHRGKLSTGSDQPKFERSQRLPKKNWRRNFVAYMNIQVGALFVYVSQFVCMCVCVCICVCICVGMCE